jgi:hypothetical protein
LNVAGGRAFLTFLHLERNLLTLGKGLETSADDGAVVDKNILAAILPGDKAITFGVVKPLHCSCNHGSTSVLDKIANLQLVSRSKIAGVTAEKTEGNTEPTTRLELQAATPYTKARQKATGYF